MRPKNFEAVLPLASGGMGSVAICLRRTDEGFERIYAVKRMHPHIAGEAEFRDMFMHEAQLAASVRHANVVTVLDVGVDEEGLFLVMEYVDALSLASVVQQLAAKGETLPLQVSVRVALDVARGLAAAHSAVDHEGRSLGIIHRDVSPQNVLVGFDGVSRLTDFGVAKAATSSTKTATGILKGKLGYAAPEALRFEPVDARADLFSLGVVVFEATAGRRLYHGQDGPRRILDEAPPDLASFHEDVPDELAALLFRLLAKRADLRPATAAEVVTTLEEVLSELVAEEGPRAVDAYMRDHFGEQQRLRNARIEQGVAALRAPSAPPVEPIPEPLEPTRVAQVPKRGRGALVALAFVAVLALLGGVAAVGLTQLDAERSSTAEIPPAPTAAPASPEPARAPEPTAVSAVEPEPVPTRALEEPAAEPVPTPRPSRRRARPVGGRSPVGF